MENKKKPTFFVFLKSRREDYEISPQFRTQMGDGYVRDGVSIQHAFSLTNFVLVVVLVVKSKAPYYLTERSWSLFEKCPPTGKSLKKALTHTGHYRYTRLIFGMNNASKYYQYHIGDAIRDCKGVHNISDDIIVHGKDQAELSMTRGLRSC